MDITIDTSCSGISQLALGVTHVDDSLVYPSGNNDLAAIENVKSMLKNGMSFQNTHIMSWGLPDPWPNPVDPDPTDWSALDSRLKLSVDAGNTPVISLDEAPWWMKGRPIAGGKTEVLTESQEWDSIAYGTRILDNKMGDWLHLVQRVAERYMVPPYNVRYFQVWNELKGYYNPGADKYDFTVSPGNPNAISARHGYTYMYNQVYNTLIKVAQSKGIPPESVKIGGPYVFMDVWTAKDQSNPSIVTKPYGTFDQRSLDVVRYWLQHKAGAGFITVDSSIENREERETGALVADPFVAAAKFADIVRWVRSLDPNLYPGSTTLPVWLSEWFAYPRNQIVDANFDNALKACTMIEFLKVGGAVALAWGGSGDGSTDLGLWTDTYVGGGQPQPWYFSAKALKDDFAPGVKLYNTTVSAPAKVEALASDQHIMLVNKTATKITVKVQQKEVELTPYQVKVIDYAH
ncbi:hypothetical protein [Ktedonospora formicarum]|uniref:D-apionate lactonase C-terminal domain-containing protein n=1 Tax=Ktedonospora formicarum TaxID=2778364 RepID=A0A8J3MVV8_9CHLR|nr:hypothetical protein [Ktedonospora formicarum]GHO46910.1 hypothetical protein KSX_50730 [Ktedonospora formicarum]